VVKLPGDVVRQQFEGSQVLTQETLGIRCDGAVALQFVEQWGRKRAAHACEIFQEERADVMGVYLCATYGGKLAHERTVAGQFFLQAHERTCPLGQGAGIEVEESRNEEGCAQGKATAGT